MSRQIPYLSTALAFLALAIWAIPGAAESLQFDRTAVSTGEVWRVFTGHFAHWTPEHLAWDLLAFGILGAITERRSRFLLVATLLTSALAISAYVWLFRDDLHTYRGLSGVDSALFAAIVTRQMAAEFHAGRWKRVLFAGLIAGGFLAKSVVESRSAAPLFVAASDSFVPVQLAHITGAACGALSALLAQAVRKIAMFQPNGSRPACNYRSVPDKADPASISAPHSSSFSG